VPAIYEGAVSDLAESARSICQDRVLKVEGAAAIINAPAARVAGIAWHTAGSTRTGSAARTAFGCATSKSAAHHESSSRAVDTAAITVAAITPVAALGQHAAARPAVAPVAARDGIGKKRTVRYRNTTESANCAAKTVRAVRSVRACSVALPAAGRAISARGDARSKSACHNGNLLSAVDPCPVALASGASGPWQTRSMACAICSSEVTAPPDGQVTRESAIADCQALPQMAYRAAVSEATSFATAAIPTGAQAAASVASIPAISSVSSDGLVRQKEAVLKRRCAEVENGAAQSGSTCSAVSTIPAIVVGAVWPISTVHAVSS